MSKKKQAATRAPAPAPAGPSPAPALQEFTLEGLQKQLAGLEAQHQQHIANANAVSGAIQFCKQMIEQMKAAAEKKA